MALGKHYVFYVLKVLELYFFVFLFKTEDVNPYVIFSNPKPQLVHPG